MNTEEEKTQSRAQLVSATVEAYFELFVLMQSASIGHWLMHELTFSQAKAVIFLAAYKELTVSQLAKLLDIGKSAASILVQQLVERGLVSRSEHEIDRRYTVVRLSEKGTEIGAGRLKERGQQWQRWLSHLSDEELNALERGLSAVRDVVRAENPLLPDQVDQPEPILDGVPEGDETGVAK